MAWPEWLDALSALWRPAFELWGSPVTVAEVIAFALSLWMVERNMRVRVLGWPLAIAASLLYGLLFARSGLYGEAALQALFIAVSLWGWWRWSRHGPSSAQPEAVLTLPSAWWGPLSVATLAAWPLMGWLLARYTDSTVPYLDAATTVASVAAQWMLGRKFVENWPAWIGVNAVSVILFWHKSLYLTSLLYALFAVLSWMGWRAWSARVDKPRTPPFVSVDVTRKAKP